MSINKIWNKCFQLTVDSLRAGNLAIASVITDSNYNIISMGTNQTINNYSSFNKISNSSIAHSEINAIYNLPKKHAQRRDLILFTTVEPCPMCLGAIAMSRIRSIHIASRDTWAGSANLLEKTSYLKGKEISVTFNNDTSIERFFLLLHVYSLFRNTKIPEYHNAIQAFRMVSAPIVQIALELSDSDQFTILIKEAEYSTIKRTLEERI